MMSTCLINICAHTHRLELLSVFLRDTSVCGQWLKQRLIILLEKVDLPLGFLVSLIKDLKTDAEGSSRKIFIGVWKKNIGVGILCKYLQLVGGGRWVRGREKVIPSLLESKTATSSAEDVGSSCMVEGKGSWEKEWEKPCKSGKACFAFGWYPKLKGIDVSLHFTLFWADTKKAGSWAVLHGGSPVSLSGKKKYIISLRTTVLCPNSYWLQTNPLSWRTLFWPLNPCKNNCSKYRGLATVACSVLSGISSSSLREQGTLQERM